jgi:hypothetical protein
MTVKMRRWLQGPLQSLQEYVEISALYNSWRLWELLENFAKKTDGLQADAVYTDFSKAFDRVNLLLGTLTRIFRGPMIFWMGSYLTGPVVHNAFGLTIIFLKRFSIILVCLRLAILVPCFFIVDIIDVLDIFENVRVLAYAVDLKLYMRVSSTDDGRLFQKDFFFKYEQSCIEGLNIEA